jgi:hypothetical protein
METEVEGGMAPSPAELVPATAVGRFMVALLDMARTLSCSPSLVCSYTGVCAQLRAMHVHWRTFDSFFKLLSDAAQEGAEERAFLLARGAISRLIDFFLWEDSPRASVCPV